MLLIKSPTRSAKNLLLLLDVTEEIKGGNNVVKIMKQLKDYHLIKN